MSRGNVEDARARRAKMDAEATALLGALNSRGRLAPLPPGTVIQGKYRIENFLRGTELRNQYVATWDDQVHGRHCWECGFELNGDEDSVCQECGSELGERQFIISERWRGNFQAYHDLQDVGLFHSGLARVYDVFEDSSRLFTVNEMVTQSFLSDLGSPFPAIDLLEMLARGCETLEYLHNNGVYLGGLGKDQVMVRGTHLLFHDLDLDSMQKSQVAAEQRRNDIERLARLLRDFTPFDTPHLRSLFDQACDGEFDKPLELIARAREVSRKTAPAASTKDIGGMSDVGMFRTLNEDSWGWERLSNDLSIFAVADGMGGHDSGEVASELAIKTILAGARRRLKGKTQFDDESLEKLLDQSFQEANNAIKEASNARRSDMGTTLVAMLVHKNRAAFVSNVGDSRAYLLRNGELLQVSQDHSLVANLVAMGKISKAAAKNHPHSNILVRTVGKDFEVEIDIFRQELKSGDLLLLCSDGLWGEVDDTEIASVLLSASEPRAQVQALIRTANHNGGHDNITALIVRIP